MDNAADDLQDRFNVHSIEEAEQLQAEHENFKAEALQEASGNYDELNGFATSMADMGSTDNPYTTLTPTVSIHLNYLEVLTKDFHNWGGILEIKIIILPHLPIFINIYAVCMLYIDVYQSFKRSFSTLIGCL